MIYTVTLNQYNKALKGYYDIKKTFITLPDAIEFISGIKKLKECESINIVAEMKY